MRRLSRPHKTASSGLKWTEAAIQTESATPTQWRYKEPLRSEQEGHPKRFQDLKPNQTSFTARFIWAPGESVAPRSSPWQHASHFRSVMPRYHPRAHARSFLTTSPQTAAENNQHFFFFFSCDFSLFFSLLPVGNE